MSANNIPLGQLCRMVDGELAGNPDITINGLADLASAGPGQISFLVKAAGLDALRKSRAAGFIVPQTLVYDEKPLIKVKDPYLAAAIIQNFFLKETFRATGIDASAVIGRNCDIPAEISIGPHVSIGDNVKLGTRVVIHPGVVIGNDVVIGDDCLIYPNVTIYHSCSIGARNIIHSGTVIGSDGFGFATDRKTGTHVKWPHVGTVLIEDDVEIGANVTIDRGTFGKTHIMKGTRIDNLVQIGHNVKVGENSVIVALVGIAGSASLGRNVVLGGQAGVKGHIHLDDYSTVAAKAGVNSSLPKGSVVSGFPAIPHKEWLKAVILFTKLPKLYSDLKEIQRRTSEMYEKIFPGKGRE